MVRFIMKIYLKSLETVIILFSGGGKGLRFPHVVPAGNQRMQLANKEQLPDTLPRRNKVNLLWSLSRFINPQIPNDFAVKGPVLLHNLSAAQ